jgi:hypothetical protein
LSFTVFDKLFVFFLIFLSFFSTSEILIISFIYPFVHFLIHPHFFITVVLQAVVNVFHSLFFSISCRKSCYLKEKFNSKNLCFYFFSFLLNVGILVCFDIISAFVILGFNNVNSSFMIIITAIRLLNFIPIYIVFFLLLEKLSTFRKTDFFENINFKNEENKLVRTCKVSN